MIEKINKNPEDRLNICKACPHLKQPLNRCEKCGCFMDVKIRISYARCPIGKW